MDEMQFLMAGEIIENRPVAPDHFQMTLRLPPSFPTPSPGQFVMIRRPGQEEPFLRRPFSIYGFHRQGAHATLDLLYRVTGRGTSVFSRMTPGETLSVLGALGRGFSLPENVRRIVLVAGGVGVAPLAFFLQVSCRHEGGGEPIDTTLYLGAGSEALIIGSDRLNGLCDLRICTDDGSRGHRGPVTDLLKRDIGGFLPEETSILACGPMPMIRALRVLLAGLPIRCQVSLEERMACGIGACLGCAVAVREDNGRINYRRVCRDGPVFDLGEIVFPSRAVV